MHFNCDARESENSLCWNISFAFKPLTFHQRPVAEMVADLTNGKQREVRRAEVLSSAVLFKLY